MVRIDTDFTNETDFALAEAGEQTVELEDVYPKQSSNGKDMVVFEFKAKNGGRIYHNCMNEEKNRWMLKKTLEAVTGRIQPHGPISFDSFDLVGKRLKVNVFHEEYVNKYGNKTKSAKISDVIPGEQVSPGQKSFIEDLESSGCPF